MKWKTTALAILLIVVSAPAQLTGGDCNKTCSTEASCTSSSLETGAGVCRRFVMIKIDQDGRITKTIICETEGGPCGDFGPLEY